MENAIATRYFALRQRLGNILNSLEDVERVSALDNVLRYQDKDSNAVLTVLMHVDRDVDGMPIPSKELRIMGNAGTELGSIEIGDELYQMLCDYSRNQLSYGY